MPQCKRGKGVKLMVLLTWSDDGIKVIYCGYNHGMLWLGSRLMMMIFGDDDDDDD